MENCCDEKHPNYEKHIPRINKISGQLNGIKKMIEEQRYCPEIITQLKAVSSACQSLEIIMLEKHLESCVLEAFQSKDKNAQAKKIKELLLSEEIIVEELSGDVQCVEISAETGMNFDKLLESIVLQSELADLKANNQTYAEGSVIEANVDKGRGVISLSLIHI